jgi:hypothetical protein
MTSIEHTIAIMTTYHSDMVAKIAKDREAISKLQEKVDSLNQRLRTQTKANQKAAGSSQKLTSSLLGMMFTGMALTRVFGGMVNKVLDALGIFEMLSATILVTLLPAVEPLADILYNLMDWFMNLDEGTQKWIGSLVLLLAGLGLFLTTAGMIIIGINAVIGVFGAMAAKIGLTGGVVKAFGGILTGLGATALIVVGIIIAIIVGMYLAFKENFMNMQVAVKLWIDGFKQAFNGLITFFSGLWDIIRGLFSGNGDLIVEGFKKLFTGLFDFLIGGLKVAVASIVAIAIGIARVVIGVFQGLINTFIAAYDWVAKILGFGGTSYRVDLIGALSNVPSFQSGGVMPHTGLAHLHKGERITPASADFNSAPTINITATIGNDYDVRRLADQLSKYWTNDMERVSQGRGI